MIHAAPKTKSKAKAKKPSTSKVASRSMSAAAATALASTGNMGGGASVNTIGGFTYDLDPSLTFPGLAEQYQIPQAPPPLPEGSPLPAQTSPSTNAPPPGTGATSRASVASSNVLTDVLQSGGKFDPTQFDFSVLTLPNTHKANRKKKEGDKAAAGNKNSSIL